MPVNPVNSRLYPGTRPAQPVLSGTCPDDWLCCWSARTHRETKKVHWELKFIHRSCPQHNRLPAV